MKHSTLLLALFASPLLMSGQTLFSSNFSNWTGNVPDGWVGSKTSISPDSISQVTNGVQYGTAAVRLANNSTSHKRFTTQPLTVVDGEAYEIKFWVRGEGEIRTGMFDGRPGNGYSPYNSYEVINSSAWAEYSQTVTAANDTTMAEFILSVRNTNLTGGGSLDIDSVWIGIGIINPPQNVPIYDIQFTADVNGNSPYQNQTVITSGIVTASHSSGYFIQDGTGPWSGVYVFDNTNTPNEGDEVEVTAQVQEYFSMTELGNVSGFSVTSTGNALPAPATLSTMAANDEQYEAVLIKVLMATCTDTAGFGQYGEWLVNDGSGGLLVDDLIFNYEPTIGNVFNITGPTFFSFGDYRIEPRDVNDIELVTGIEEQLFSDISLYPIPANDQITISLGDVAAIGSGYALMDASGRAVAQGLILNERTQLNTSGLAEGHYMLQLTNDLTVKTFKVSVVR